MTLLKLNFFFWKTKVTLLKREERVEQNVAPRHTHTHLLYLYLNVGQRKPLTSPIEIETKTTHALGGALSKYGEQRHFKLTRFLCDSRSEYCSEQQCEDGTLW